MKTRITETLGIKQPIILSGVSFGSDPKLAAAVSNAGGLGILGGAIYTPDGLRAAIKEIRNLTGEPFGVNITFTNPGVRELIKVLLEEKVPVINYALGRATELIKAVHDYGGKVVASVALVRHALRAEQDEADALIVTGHEAAAHGGNVGSLVLIPAVASKIKAPFAAAGGFCDGKGLAAALALGADGIAMGTAFMLTRECTIHQRTKESLLKATEEDTVITDRWDGMPGRILKNRAVDNLTRDRLPVIKSLSGMLAIKKLLGVSWWELLSGARQTAETEGISLRKLSGRPISFLQMRRAMIEGNEETGVVPIGQAVGRIEDIPSCAEMIERIITEAEATIKDIEKFTR